MKEDNCNSFLLGARVCNCFNVASQIVVFIWNYAEMVIKGMLCFPKFTQTFALFLRQPAVPCFVLSSCCVGVNYYIGF